MLAVLVSAAGTSASLYVLLTAVPMYAATGVAGGVAAGLTSGALMLSSVAAELATPILVARFGYRAAFGAGLILLGAPALLLPVSTELAIVLAICVGSLLIARFGVAALGRQRVPLAYPRPSSRSSVRPSHPPMLSAERERSAPRERQARQQH